MSSLPEEVSTSFRCAEYPTSGDLVTFVHILIARLSKEHIQAIVEALSDASDGRCVVCQCEDIPVDEQGNEIVEDNVEDAFEWQECHYEGCPVVLFEQSLKEGVA